MEYLKVSADDHIAVFTMSNAPVNVLSSELIAEMTQAFAGLRDDPDVWAVVLCSDQKIFAAGADLKSLKDADSRVNYEVSENMQRLLLQIESFPHPVICAVHGNCMGGGLELALACDLRVFDARVKAALPECGLGICPGAGGTVRLTRLIGAGRAKRLIFTGEMLSAQDAYELGICEYVAEEGRVLEKAMEIAAVICSKSPLGIAAAKRSIVYAQSHELVDSLRFENENTSALFDTEDSKEGIAAFFEKRKPEFRNR